MYVRRVFEIRENTIEALKMLEISHIFPLYLIVFVKVEHYLP